MASLSMLMHCCISMFDKNTIAIYVMSIEYIVIAILLSLSSIILQELKRSAGHRPVPPGGEPPTSQLQADKHFNVGSYILHHYIMYQKCPHRGAGGGRDAVPRYSNQVDSFHWTCLWCRKAQSTEPQKKCFEESTMSSIHCKTRTICNNFISMLQQ